MFKKDSASPFDTQRGQTPEVPASGTAAPCSEGCPASTTTTPPPASTVTPAPTTHDSTVQVIIPDTESTPEGSVTQQSATKTVEVQRQPFDSSDELLSDPQNTNPPSSSGSGLDRVAPTSSGPMIVHSAGYSQSSVPDVEIPINNQVTSRIPARSPTTSASLQVRVAP